MKRLICTPLRLLIAVYAAATVFLLVYAAAFAASPTETNADEIGGIPTNIMMWGTIIGFFGSPVITAINRRRWSSELKAASAFVWCFIGALGTVYFSNNFDIQNLATTFLFTTVTAIASYEKIWKPTGIVDKIYNVTG
jgi:hypothetical protein